SSAASYSNFGASVDIWAPGDTPVASDGDTFPAGKTATGTSQAAPLVSGTAAMLRAMDPSLDSDGVRAILQATAHTGSPDPKVTAYMDAFAAVKVAAGNQIFADQFEPDNQPGQGLLIPGQNFVHNIETIGAVDWYKFTMPSFGDAEIDLEQMIELGSVDLSVISPGAPPQGVTLVTSILGSQGKAKGLHAGTYLVKVSSQTPQPYRLTFTPNPLGLQPDQFEDNNMWDYASTPVDGAYDCNFHFNLDGDYYKFDPPAPPANDPWATFHFTVLDASVPAELLLFGPDFGKPALAD